MRVEKLGDGDPEYAVVACLHGNETCGWNAIQRFKRDDYEIQKPIKFVLANEEAYEKDERYIDTDINRVFPGNSNSSVHEERLAAEIQDELEGQKILDIHSTKSEQAPFAIVVGDDDEQIKLAKSTGIKHLIDMSYVDGGLGEELPVVSIELSRTSQDQDEEAYKLLVNFLAAEGIIKEEFDKVEPEFFKVFDREGDGSEEFRAENFSKVNKGDVYAQKFIEKEDGNKNTEPIRAEEDFYPVLMSTDGYDEMLGFKAQKKDI